MHIAIIGGSDAGISAALRARELDPDVDVTVVVADRYPNFSICGIPYYFSGDVKPWQSLAHRTSADLEATGMTLRLDTLATRIDVADRALEVRDAGGTTSRIGYDELIVGTGAVPSTAGIAGLDQLGPDDGVHVLHSMGDTFALERHLDERTPRTAIIIGAGYVGLEMAEGLSVRGIRVTQLQRGPEVLSTLDPELGALVHAELTRHGVEVVTDSTVGSVTRGPDGLTVAGTHLGRPFERTADLVLAVVGSCPTRACSSTPAPGSAPETPSWSTRPCAPACPTSGPQATGSSPTTASSASPTCRWAPPRTSRGASPERTPSAGPRASPEASEPRR
jgi:Uncharacterized NAD(FAD)-dependent dehydrogenases